MNVDPPGSFAELVARYLLIATVGVVAVDGTVDIVPGTSVHVMAILVAAVFVALAARPYIDRRKSDEPAAPPDEGLHPEQKWIVIALLALVVIGTVLRGYALGSQSLWFDEAITANAAIALLEHGTPTFPSGYTYWRGFPHTLVVAGSMAVFGTGEAAARLPSVVFGVATIPATYWLGRLVGGREIGLVTAGLVTFATWEIAWSRQARMYQLFQLLFTLALILLLRVDRRGLDDSGTVCTLALVTVLAAWTHPIGYVVLPLGVGYLGLGEAVDGRLTATTLGGLLVVGLGSLLVFELAGGVWSVFEGIAMTDVDYVSEYVGWTIAEFGAIYILGLIGTGVTFYRGHLRAGLLLVLSVVPATWVLSFHTELFASRYLYFGVPVLFVWASVTVVYVTETVVGSILADWDWGRVSTVDRLELEGLVTIAPFAMVFGLLVLVGNGGVFTTVPHTHYDLGPNAPQPDFAAAYGYVNEHRQAGDVIIAGWTAPGVYYAGGVDYWLAHDLTGQNTTWTVGEGDRYAGAKPIHTVDEIEAVTAESRTVWLVADDVAKRRQSKELNRWMQREHTCQRRFWGITVYVFTGADREVVCR